MWLSFNFFPLFNEVALGFGKKNTKYLMEIKNYLTILLFNFRKIKQRFQFIKKK
jgi:hypothetical protein